MTDILEPYEEDWEVQLKHQYTCTQEEEFRIEPGEYYIGDLCYVLDDSLYHSVFGGYGFQDGVYRKKDKPSVLFAMAGTGGDGCFKGSNGWTFDVDAGIIGIASKELCVKNDGGHFVPFKTPAKCIFRNLTRGDGEIVIETDDNSFYLRIENIYEEDQNEE
jgi:hypothetical protein